MRRRSTRALGWFFPLTLFVSIASAQVYEDQGVAILGRMTATAGWASSQLPADAVIAGDFVRVSDGVEHSFPVTFKIKGHRRYKMETESGFVSILNDTETVVRSSEGKRKLSGYSSLSKRPLPLPFLSALVSATSGQYDIRYLGAETLKDQVCDRLLIEPRPTPSNPKDPAVRAGRLTVWISRQTSLPSQIEFVRLAETNPTASLEYIVRYADYRRVDGVAIPFHLEEYVRSRLRYTFRIATVQLNTGIVNEEFTTSDDSGDE